jgi:nicotinate-nucleotide adenylyltransferase
MSIQSGDSPTICLYGGTFDPPHKGHVAAANAVIEALGPDEMWIVVAEDPGYREAPQRTARQRRELALAAFASLAVSSSTSIRISDIERRLVEQLGREPRTVDVVNEVARLRPGAQISVAIGADQLVYMRTWHSWRELLATARIVVVPRPDVVSEAELSASIRHLRSQVAGAQITCIPMPAVPVSSTLVRTKLGHNDMESVRRMVPSSITPMLKG